MTLQLTTSTYGPVKQVFYRQTEGVTFTKGNRYLAEKIPDEKKLSKLGEIILYVEESMELEAYIKIDGVDVYITAEGRPGRRDEFTYSATGEDPEKLTEVGKLIEKAVKKYVYVEPDTPETITAGFWNFNQSRGVDYGQRVLDCPDWKDIKMNYSKANRAEIKSLLNKKNAVGNNGKFVLWHGEPGTGKTNALLTFAKESKDWCSVEYVLDPEKFFSDTSYMMNILNTNINQKEWRLLVFEDAGELLTPDARKEIGQGLSRFLNLCDGILGRGQKVVIMITTNEPLNKLHEAVQRPGRLASVTEFTKLSESEANAWLKKNGKEETATQPMSIAELYNG